MEIMKYMETEGIDAIIPGEIIEWTILSYIRDAAYMGKHKACFNIGHFNMEELGMKYAADWIGELLNNKIPVNYIPTEDGWTFLIEEVIRITLIVFQNIMMQNVCMCSGKVP